MSVDRGLLVILEAHPGKEDELAAFLTQAEPLAAAEPGTVTWYAFKLSDTTFGIFNTFSDEDGRQAHLNGPVAAALGQAGPGLLAEDPDVKGRHPRREVNSAKRVLLRGAPAVGVPVLLDAGQAGFRIGAQLKKRVRARGSRSPLT